MGIFTNPFQDSDLTRDEKLDKLKLKLKNLYGARLSSYSFVRGALDSDPDLEMMFYQKKYIPENFSERYVEQHKLELKYIEELNRLKELLSSNNPTSEAYHEISEGLEVENIKERFENDIYFPKRERIIFYHLEFLYNEDPNILLDNILPHLANVNTKNMFSLLRFNIFDLNCENKVDESGGESAKVRVKYLEFCERCIEAISRFGNMKESDGDFVSKAVEDGKDELFNLSIKMLLTFLDINISKYMEVEIEKEELKLLEEIESGHQLIYQARMVKKPMKEFDEAKELATNLQELIILVEFATEKELLPYIKDQNLSINGKELKNILETAQKKNLTEAFEKAKEEIQKISELSSSDDNSVKNSEEKSEPNYVLEYTNSIDDEVKEAIKSIQRIEERVNEVASIRSLKVKKIEKLMKDSKKGDPYYYKYINKILYILKFFRFDTSILLKDLLLQCDGIKGFTILRGDFCNKYKTNDELTVEDYLVKIHKDLNNIYQQQFSKIKRFETGFELSKQINSILLTLLSTTKELNRGS